MPPRVPRALLAPVLLLLLVSTGGCRKSDAERAAEERAKIEEHIRDSLLLVPYRSLKLAARAGGSDQVPEEVREAWSSVQRSVEKMKELPETPLTTMDKARSAGVALELGVSLYRVQRVMRTHDEDEFPLLWDRLGLELPPGVLIPGYDAGMEHLFVGTVWGVLTGATKGKVEDLSLYELSRAQPRAEWPDVLRTAVRAGRGLSFQMARYHYAADEELTAYLDEVSALSGESLHFLASRNGYAEEQQRQALLMLGYTLRAVNRQALKRDELAMEDLMRALDAMAAMGVENELSWWGWALVHARHERYEEAAVNLDKLALSPYLDEPTREELRDNARQLREHSGRVSLFREQRAMFIVSRALLARAGGLEQLLVPVLGEAQARRVATTFSSVERLLEGVAGTKSEDVVRASEGVLDQARQAGREGLSRLKQELDDAAKKATAGSGPP